MGANSTVAITAGSGTALRTYDDGSGNKHQYVREITATASTHGSWTLSTTASTSAIAADVQRVGITFVNNGNARVYMRFDSTAPTATVNHWYLEPGDRWDVSSNKVTLAYSFVSEVGSGALTYSLQTVT